MLKTHVPIACIRIVVLMVPSYAQAPLKVANAKKSSILNRVKLADFQSSTKIEALREELALMLASDPSAKALVFSQFTSMLDLVYYRLQQACPLLPGNPPVLVDCWMSGTLQAFGISAMSFMPLTVCSGRKLLQLLSAAMAPNMGLFCMR